MKKKPHHTTYAVLGGYGEMGRITSRDLVETTQRSRIYIVGRREEEARQYAAFLSKLAICKKNKNLVSGIKIDVSQPDELLRFLKQCNICLNCTQYTFNLEVMQACLRAKTHYLDLGGLFHMTNKQLKLNKDFKRIGRVAVLGCGSTPGITNVLAAYGASSLTKIREIHVRFANYDQTKYKTHFVLPYSISTLFDEFSKSPAVFTHGKLRFVPPLSGKKEEYFPEPFGRVSTFYTLHSELATFPSSFKEKGIKECSFKVSFIEDFVHDILLLRELGFDSTRPIFVRGQRIKPIDIIRVMTAHCIPGNNVRINDMEIIRVQILGVKSQKPISMTLDCIADAHRGWNASASDIDTGTPISIMAQMIVQGCIKTPGVYPPELIVPPHQFFEELAQRGMKIVKTVRSSATA